MVVVLARPPKEKEKPPHDPYAWYGRALKEGYGILAPLPDTDEDAFDRLMGLFVYFLGRRMEYDTFFAVHTTKNTSEMVRAHAIEMLALFPQATLLIEKEKTDACLWLEVEERTASSDTLFAELEQAITNARHQNQKVVVSYNTQQHEPDETFKRAVQAILTLEPDFFVTDRPRQVRTAVDAVKKEPRMRVFRRWKPIYYLRNRIGLLRFKIRTLPLYTLIYVLESITGQLISLHMRPLYARDYTLEADVLKEYPRCAIMMQGPIMHKRNFTLETIRLYRKVFPEVQLVVSTWDDEDAQVLEQLRNAGAEVVTSRKPEYGGPGNTNMQLASGLAGVKRAKELGAQYIVKQRTDIRIYNARAMETMCNLLKYFPPSSRSKQKARILFGTGSNTYQPYQYGEFLFGAAEDIVDYYSAPPIAKGQEYEHYLVEMYIPTAFLKKRGWDLKWTIAHGWEVYRECFIALDWSALDIYWYKYYNLRFWEYQNQRQYTRSPLLSQEIVAFDEWFNIFVAQENKILRPNQRLFTKLVPRTEDL